MRTSPTSSPASSPTWSPVPTGCRRTLTGDVEDQQELQGVLNFLDAMGVTVLEVVTIPE